MKRFYLIGLLFAVVCTGAVLSARADDYVDDVYYSTETALTEQLQSGELTPYYDKKNMQEVIFTDPVESADSLQTAVTDTIR